MASIPFTLAALATSAVPGLTVSGAAAWDNDPEFACAVLETDRGTLVARVPRTPSAEVRQSAMMLGLAALSDGARASFGFVVPETLGVTRAGDTRAVITTKLPGTPLTADQLAASGDLLSTVAEALAAVHDLPPSPVLQGGLPSRDARESRLAARRIIERASQTRFLPETVLQRWDRVMSDEDTWDFAPTVIHGALCPEDLYVEGDRIVGIDGWSELAVGDPAVDLGWLIDVDPEVFEAVVPRYSRLNPSASVPSLRTRAQLYHELMIAQHLVQGIEQHDQEKVDLNVAQLDQLVDRLSLHPGEPERVQPTREEVESMLANTPEVVDRLSDTAAQEALDEDRMFGHDTDFIEPLPAEGTEDDADEQPTDAIDEADLPQRSPDSDESSADGERN